MTKETLDEFLKNSIPLKRRRAFIRHRGFKELYVRHTERFINGARVSPVIDLANIEVRTPGRGTFTKFLGYLRETYPNHWIYVECVLNERFVKKLLELGFVQNDFTLSPSLYLAPAVRTYFLNEVHTEHITKSQARKEREALRKAKKHGKENRDA